MADAHLYGNRQPKNNVKEISSSTSISFATQLSSLIPKKDNSGKTIDSTTTATSNGRVRPSKTKPDIFSTHNRNSKKRALADLEGDLNDGKPQQQRHKTEQDLGGSLDSSDLHRSRRKMEEKARLYSAMKRGDYVAPSDGRGRNDQASGLVDFDRKWAERESRGEREDDNDTSSGSDNDNDSEDDTAEDLVDYTDEFGRERKMTKSQIAREERRKRIQSNFAQDAENMSARPAMPEKGIIYGDTVQHAAFNPDDDTATKMADLAAKRDREATPPDETHYDASKEIRNKGTGFYSFSGDAEGRKKEMEALEKERLETERRRRERESVVEERRKALKERRSLLARKKAENMAERFLGSLDLPGSTATDGLAEPQSDKKDEESEM